MTRRVTLAVCASLSAWIAFTTPTLAQVCNPTAESDVIVRPLRADATIKVEHGIDEIAAAREQLAAIPIIAAIASPNLGFLQIPSLQFNLKTSWHYPSPSDVACGQLTSVEVELGVKARTVLIASEFARDACLNNWIRASIKRLDDWEDEVIVRAAVRLGGPLQAALRALTWNESDTRDVATKRVSGLISPTVDTQSEALLGRLLSGRADYFAKMEKLLDTACESRGAAILRTIGSRPM
jgi:hypothetical protein